MFRRDTLNARFRDWLRAPVADFVVHRTILPAYRFVDAFRAIAAQAEAEGEVSRLDLMQQHVPLEALLQAPRHDLPRPHAAGFAPWPVSATDMDHLPQSAFWLVRRPAAVAGLIVRLQHNDYTDNVEFTVAADSSLRAQSFVDAVLARSLARSIHRNADIRLGYESARRDDYGDVEKPERLTVGFVGIAPVADVDIVLSAHHAALLQRNIIDMDARREVLRNAGIPARRGLLLHGPPGTGKTYACRYVAGRMPRTTRIFLTGRALVNVNAVFSLARTLQPAVIFIEDADLMFTSRDINIHSTSLGELMDQLDGLPANDEISLVMTTNAIDRMEAALKDRPGRISQSLFLGAPDADLLAAFLARLLRDHDAGAADMGALVRMSDGVTQAFLKEWVLRALQFASEAEGAAAIPAPATKDFEAALEEMRSDREDAASRIVGFGRVG